LHSDKQKLSQPMRNLSMLRSIQAFEAAARHKSYAAAAAELHVTPAAVGQQVRALETWLGQALFLRLAAGAKRLVLTEAAAAALPDFSEGLDCLDGGLRRLRQQRQRSTVTVSASQALVARWLLPRLESFNSSHPEVDVRLDVSDRLVDVQHGEADLAIRCGAGRWPGLKATRLMKEEVYPVCSPTLVAHKAVPRTAAQLAKLPLIHDSTLAATQALPTWQAWLVEQGHALPAARGIHINSSAAAIQAALNGQGVTLARAALVQGDVAQGRLLRLLPHVTWPITWAYFCVHTEKALDRPATQQFVSWLVQQAHEQA
jgi:LysR family transcriptional regulator, glycine cleavage system transcriptional activator